MTSSYSPDTISGMPWLTSSTGIGNGALKNNLQTIHPVFLELSEKVDDPHWKLVLINASKGKLGKGFVFNGRVLMCKNGTQTVEIVGNRNAATEVVMFYRKHTGIRSKMDHEREKDLEKYNQSKIVTISKWSDITSKDIKRLIIIDFAAKMRLKYKLSESEYNQLMTLLNIHCRDPNVSENIVLNDGSIEEISNLIWNPQTRIFSLDGVIPRVKNLQYNTLENVSYINGPLEIQHQSFSTIKDWSKFLKEFNKSVGRGDKTGVPPGIKSPRKTPDESSDYMESSC